MDNFEGTVHKLSCRLKFIVSHLESVLVLADSQALLITKLRQVRKQGQCLVCNYIFLSVNLYLVENQPGVNVSTDDLILSHSSCGANALKASWMLIQVQKMYQIPGTKPSCTHMFSRISGSWTSNASLHQDSVMKLFENDRIYFFVSLQHFICRSLLFKQKTSFCLSFPWRTACQKPCIIQWSYGINKEKCL